ncbi:hypothetical protein ACFLWM_00015 [Chloroflexota bacterium]
METGIIIVGTITLFLMGFGMRDFFANPDVHIGLRVGVAIIGGGVLWLVIRNIRAKITRAKTEKAEEVEK